MRVRHWRKYKQIHPCKEKEYRRSPALEQLLENDVDSYEIVEMGDIQVDDLLLSAEEHQAMLAQGEAPYNWESESGQVT